MFGYVTNTAGYVTKKVVICPVDLLSTGNICQVMINFLSLLVKCMARGYIALELVVFYGVGVLLEAVPS